MNMNYLEQTFTKLFADQELVEDNYKITLYYPKYYIIKVTTADGKVMYKVGETTVSDPKKLNDADVENGSIDTRPGHLVKKYTEFDQCDAKVIANATLPFDEKSETRTSDKMLHNYLKTKGFRNVSRREAWEAVKAIDGIDEFFEKDNFSECDEEIKRTVKDGLNEFKETATYKAGFKRTQELISKSKHVVDNKLTAVLNDFMVRNLNLDLRSFSNSTIMFIGQMSTRLCRALLDKGNTLYLLPDEGDNLDDLLDEDEWFVDRKKLYIITGTTEKRIMEIKNVHFNLVLANPPYARGNEITKAVVTKVDFDNYVNLMPLGNYQDRNLSNYVEKMELVDPKHFADAKVQDNLCVCSLTKKQSQLTYDELALDSYAPAYRDYYELNNKCRRIYSNRMRCPVKEGNTLNPQTTFVTGKRVCKDGVHKTTDTYDYHFNILKDISNRDLPVDNAHYDIWSMQFRTAVEKEHFNEFWYKNPLTHELIKGLRKSGGSPDPAIPRIDFSKDRDYANLTVADLMNILREENHL